MFAMLAGSGGMLSTPDFWVGASFVLFLLFLVYYGVPGMIGKALDDRADAIRKELDEARRLREEAQSLLADYQRKAREAEAEAEKIVEQARRDAEAMAAEARQSLHETVARRAKQAEDKIARAEAQAVNDVRGAAVESAIAAAERVIKTRVAGSQADQLVDASIQDLRGKLN
jgi:F-type H+-transporting ATPase subunit b